jgi:uncharacterized SAM-binding protein YcdF (DUF218 family)
MLHLFLLPLGVISLLLGFALVLSFRAREGHSLLLANASFVFVVFIGFTTPLGSNFLVGYLEHDDAVLKICSEERPLSMVVVLSGGLHEAPDDAADIDTVTESTFQRVVGGVRLASSLPGSTLLLSGGGWWRIKEAEIMRALAVKLGFPASRIRLETASHSTHESVKLVMDMLRGYAVHDLWLVTSAIHMPRSLRAFTDGKFMVCPYPVERQYRVAGLPGALIPQIGALKKSTAALHEILGIAWYRLTGRI